MTTRDDLVSRLKRQGSGLGGYRTVFNGLLNDAASAIEAAESRISDLERQLAEETERCADVALSSMKSKNLADRSPSHVAAAIRGGAK